MPVALIPNTALAELIAQAHWSNGEVASAVNHVGREFHLTLRYDDSSVWHWIKGTVPRRRVHPVILEVFRRRLRRPVTIADLGFPVEDEDVNIGLTLTEDPVIALRQLADADLARRAFLTHAAFSVLALASVVPRDHADALTRLQRSSRAVLHPGARVGVADIEAVRDLTASLTAVDERLGGQHGRESVVMWLAQDVTAMCNGRFASDSIRAQMFSAAAEVAYLAGWKSHDAGLDSLAQRYYLQAHQLADRAGNPEHSAYILRIMAHHALDINQPQHCIDVAEEALHLVTTTSSSPRLHAFYAATVARAHAAAGNTRHAGIWLARAETLSARDDDEAVPSWVSLGGAPETRMASHTAKTLTALGRYQEAEPLYRLAAGRWNPVTHPRVLALSVHQLGRAQAAQGHLDQACATWSGSFDVLTPASRSSVRARKAMSDIRTIIAAPRHRNSAAAKQLWTMFNAPAPAA